MLIKQCVANTDIIEFEEVAPDRFVLQMWQDNRPATIEIGRDPFKRLFTEIDAGDANKPQVTILRDSDGNVNLTVIDDELPNGGVSLRISQHGNIL